MTYNVFQDPIGFGKEKNYRLDYKQVQTSTKQVIFTHILTTTEMERLL